MKERIKKALFEANKAYAEKYAIDADYDTLADAIAETLREYLMPDGKNVATAGSSWAISYVQGWNDCRDSMLAAAAKPKWKVCPSCTTPDYCTNSLRGCDITESQEAGIEPIAAVPKPEGE